MSAIFYHDEEQKKLAVESMERQQAETHGKIYTEIVPAAMFYPAEDYHQKYYLRQRPDLVSEFRVIYPHETFVDSTAAARINGFLAGYGSYAALKADLSELLSPEEDARMLRVLGSRS